MSAIEYVLSPASTGFFSCVPTEQADQRAHAVGAHVAEGHGVWAGWVAITADKAYDSQKVRQQIKDEGALPIIPSRSNATKKAYCPKRFYRRRHKIENFFCRIKDWRRIATRYDKLARNFLAAADLVGALYWIKL